MVGQGVGVAGVVVRVLVDRPVRVLVVVEVGNVVVRVAVLLRRRGRRPLGPLVAVRVAGVDVLVGVGRHARVGVLVLVRDAAVRVAVFLRRRGRGRPGLGGREGLAEGGVERGLARDGRLALLVLAARDAALQDPGDVDAPAEDRRVVDTLLP